MIEPRTPAAVTGYVAGLEAWPLSRTKARHGVGHLCVHVDARGAEVPGGVHHRLPGGGNHRSDAVVDIEVADDDHFDPHPQVVLDLGCGGLEGGLGVAPSASVLSNSQVRRSRS